MKTEFYLTVLNSEVRLIPCDKMPPEPIQTNAWSGKDYRENAFNTAQKHHYEYSLQKAKEESVLCADQEKAKREKGRTLFPARFRRKKVKIFS